MLTPDGCRSRLQRFRDRLDGPWDAAVIHTPEHLLYLANFFALPNSLNYSSSTYLLVERDGPSTLFTDNWLLRADGGPEPLPHTPRVPHAADAVDVVDWYTCEAPAENRAALVASRLHERLEALGVRRLAAETAHLPAALVPATGEVFDCEPLLRRMREIKDADEVDAIRLGIRTAEGVHAASRDLLRPGISEIDYYAALVERATSAAGRPFVMMCDLASGPRAAQGGGGPTDRIILEGDLVIHDIFPFVEGYRGDITNTLVTGGKANGEQQEIFVVVRGALERAASLLRPGTPVAEIHRTIDEHFRAAGDYSLVHHAGHAIGLGHPEAPELVPRSDRVLEAGMVVTLEPGIYGLPSGGIRLEHDYLITADGAEQMSTHQLGL